MTQTHLLPRRPGTLAKKYASLNARCQVRLCGKPDPIIYNACQDALTLDPSQVLAGRQEVLIPQPWSQKQHC